MDKRVDADLEMWHLFNREAECDLRLTDLTRNGLHVFGGAATKFRNIKPC